MYNNYFHNFKLCALQKKSYRLRATGTPRAPPPSHSITNMHFSEGPIYPEYHINFQQKNIGMQYLLRPSFRGYPIIATTCVIVKPHFSKLPPELDFKHKKTCEVSLERILIIVHFDILHNPIASMMFTAYYFTLYHPRLIQQIAQISQYDE